MSEQEEHRSLMSRRQFLKKCLLWGTVGAVFADAIVYEPRSPRLSTFNIAIPGLPEDLDGFRIVQLSDLHRRLSVPDAVIKNAVKIANSANPDIAVFTGDYVGRDIKDADACFEMLSKIDAKTGTYAVLGNHDYWAGVSDIEKSLKENGIHLLKNSNIKVAEGFYLVGIDDDWAGKPDIPAAFKEIDEQDCCIMLSHSPFALYRFRGKNGLMLTGHTHGGQINLPLPGKYRYPGLLSWKYKSGWYKMDDVLMYVNSGIGMIHPAVRFLCRPEVTLFILHPTTRSRAYVMEL